jgi:hypothetical protein
MGLRLTSAYNRTGNSPGRFVCPSCKEGTIMKKKALIVLISLLCFVTVPALTLAQDTLDLSDAEADAMAKAMVVEQLLQDDVEFYKANGKDEALKSSATPKGSLLKTATILTS